MHIVRACPIGQTLTDHLAHSQPNRAITAKPLQPLPPCFLSILISQQVYPQGQQLQLRITTQKVCVTPVDR